MTNLLLEARALTVRLDGRTLWHVENLKISAGDCLLIHGTNGSGKTTLFRILAGLMPASGGEILIEGFKASRAGCRRCLSYMHQEPYMFDGDVASNLAYSLARQGLAGSGLKRRVEEALADFGLEPLAQRDARTLSVGESRILALARVLLRRPRMVLLDEPFASLDEVLAERVRRLIDHALRSDMAVAVSAHGELELPGFSDWSLERGGLVETRRTELDNFGSGGRKAESIAS